VSPCSKCSCVLHSVTDICKCTLTLCSSSRPHGLLLQCSIVQGSSHWQHGQ
jgi:hypothetical protein